MWGGGVERQNSWQQAICLTYSRLKRENLRWIWIFRWGLTNFNISGNPPPPHPTPIPACTKYSVAPLFLWKANAEEQLPMSL